MNIQSVKEPRGSELSDAAEALVAGTSESSFDAAMFFEKFESLASVPGAISKLREIIYAAAFSGQLSGTEGDYPVRTINSICEEIAPGFACSKSHQTEDGHVHLRTHNISTKGQLNFDLLVRIDPAQVDNKKSSLLKDDILFNNTNSQELVGKTAIIDQDYEFGFSNHLTRLRMKPIAYSRFVVHYLTHLRNSGYFASLCTRWINQAAVNSNALKQLNIPLPPLAEQKRIVAKVDVLMGLCDRLEALETERKERHGVLSRAAFARFADTPTPRNLKFLFHKSFDVELSDLRTLILTLAVEGLLEPQRENERLTEDSLEILLKSKRTLEAEEGVRGRPSVKQPSRDDWPAPFPSTWQLPNFDQVAIMVSGVTKGRKLIGRKTLSAPYLRVANVQRWKLDLTVMKHIEVLPDDIKKYKLKSGDVLMTEGGDWDKVGRAAIWNSELECCIHQNHVFRVRSADKSQLLPQWIVLVANSPVGRRYFERASKQTTNLASINMTQLRGCPLPLPHIQEQKRIVAKVEELMALADELERQLVESRSKGQQLMEAIVARLTAASDGSRS